MNTYKPVTVYELQEDSFYHKKGERFFVLFQGQMLTTRTVKTDGSIEFTNYEFMKLPIELRKKFFIEIPVKRNRYVQNKDSFSAKEGSEWFVYPEVDPNLLIRFNESNLGFADTRSFSNDEDLIKEWFDFDGIQTQDACEDPFASILFYDPKNPPAIPGSQDDAPQDDAPQDDAPQDDAPQDDAPQDDAPQDDAPQDDAPQDDAPQDDAPQTEQVEDPNL
jgi:hypothetical protein